MTSNIHKSKNSYTVRSWKIDNLYQASKDHFEKKKIVIPRFQRDIVWSEKQKFDFIESVKKGYPFGSLLLAEDKRSGKDELTNYILIDGLQRTTTLIEHKENPNKYFPERIISTDLLNKIFLEIELPKEKEFQKKEEISQSIKRWVERKKGFDVGDEYTPHDLVKTIVIDILEDKDVDIIDKVLTNSKEIIIEFLETVKSNANIDDNEIPIIIYFGDRSDLPEIFEKINTKGTKLSKYQIFAAIWDTEKIQDIKDKTIKDEIKQKYESIQDNGYELIGYDPDTFNKGPFNVFEFLYGLGKIITKNNPLLFGEIESVQAESIGFNLTAICLGISLKEMEKKLPSKIRLLNQEAFLNALDDSIDSIYKQLEHLIMLQPNLRGRKDKPKPRIYHTDYQIISLIGKYFSLKYDEEFKVRKEWKEIRKIFEPKIRLYYLYDLLSENWRGSGDKRIMDMMKTNYYLNEISRERWNNILDEWFINTQLIKREHKRTSVDNLAYLFLNYIYSELLSWSAAYSENDLEHLIPISRLKDLCEKNNEGLPISAVSNTCYLPTKINKEKKDKTIYEYYDQLLSLGEIDQNAVDLQISDMEVFTLTKREDLSFINNLNRDTYLEFLKKRFNKMKALFIEKNVK